MEILGTVKTIIGIGAIILVVFFVWSAIDDVKKDHDDK